MKETGNGVMLSSKDYFLIREWELKGIPESVIKQGISLAVRNNGESIKNLYSCKELIEEIYAESGKILKQGYEKVAEKADSQFVHSGNELVNNILARIDTISQKEKDQRRRSHYLKFRKKLQHLAAKERDDLFDLVNRLERQFFDEFFSFLAVNDQNLIETEANSMLSEGTGFIDEQDREETLRHFRNELIEKRFNLVNIFDYS